LFARAVATSVIAQMIRQIGQLKTQIAVEIVGNASASQLTTAINEEIAQTASRIFAVSFGCSLIRSATF
jgi:RecA/RadA recombinase